MVVDKVNSTLTNEEKDRVALVIDKIIAAELLLAPVKDRNPLTKKASEVLKQATTCCALAIACPPERVAKARWPHLFTLMADIKKED